MLNVQLRIQKPVQINLLDQKEEEEDEAKVTKNFINKNVLNVTGHDQHKYIKLTRIVITVW